MAYIGIPAFIVTLAGMLVLRGLTQIVLENQRITRFLPEYRQLGGDSLFPGLFSPATNILDWTTVGIGLITTALLVVSQLRGRAGRAKLHLEDEPRAWFLTRLVFGVVVILALTFLLASSRGGTPIVLVVLGAGRHRRRAHHGRAQQRHVPHGGGIDYQQFIKGLVLLLAVGFDVFNKRRASNALA